MVIKHLVFGLLPLLCHGETKREEFLKNFRDKDENAYAFFEKIFNDLDKRKLKDQHEKKQQRYCAVFDLDHTLIEDSSKSPVFNYQLKNAFYKFGPEDVGKVYGFENAIHRECIPTFFKYTYKGQKLDVNFTVIVNEIKKIFLDDDKEKRKTDRFKALSAAWRKLVYIGMRNNPKCKYLMSTAGYRALYGMSQENLKEIVNEVVKMNEKDDVYIFKIDGVDVEFRERNRVAKVYQEHIKLMRALEESGTTSLLVTATHKLYAGIAYQFLEGTIDPENMYCSHPPGEGPSKNFFDGKLEDNMLEGNGFANVGEGKVETVKKLLGPICDQMLLSCGDNLKGDGGMIQYTIEEQHGYGLIMYNQARGINKELLQFAKDRGDRCRVQSVKDGKWSETSPKDQIVAIKDKDEILEEDESPVAMTADDSGKVEHNLLASGTVLRTGEKL